MRQVIKSISDRRIYRPLTLPNQLECLLISDRDAQKSAAALSVGVGSFLDPQQAQGLAHYLEHMLFMGTQKYPAENEYSEFLSKNVGSSNAYTGLQQTNYFFQVSHGAFTDALDRFSRFFVDPLMLDSSSQRQLEAVNSEHSKNIQSDPWRKYQLTKHLAKENSPYHKFSTGDKTTLGNPDLRKMLFEFYNSNYSSNLMKLVVYGQSDIDTLAKEVQSRFTQVKNNNYQRFQLQELPFDHRFIGQLVKLVPVKDKRTLQLTWFIDNQTPHARHPPSKYVSHLLGHQGKGSLLSFLISQGLATSLSAGGSDSFDCYSQFEVTIQLTDKGVQSIPIIISYVFEYISMLRKRQPQRWVVQEIQRVNKMKFDFLAKSQGMNYCAGLAKNMHKRQIEELLIQPYLMDDFKPQLITQYLQALTPSNYVAVAQSKTFIQQCNQTQPIYQTKYTTEPLANLQQLPCRIDFPPHNSFIPDDLTVLPLSSQIHPRKFYQSEQMQGFFKEDHFFGLPKAQMNLRLYFDGQNTVRQEVVRQLFDKMLTENLREFAYMAQMAQLQSQFSFSGYYTLNIKIEGFRDSFDRYTSEYLRQIMSFKPSDTQLFKTLKEKTRKQYANYFLNQPYQLCYNTVTNALREGFSTNPRLKLQQIQRVQLEDLVAYAQYWKRRVYMEYFISGNIQEAQALKIAKQIEEQVQGQSQVLPKHNIGVIRPVFLPLGKTSAVEQTIASKQETNNSLLVHYQYQASNLINKVIQELAYSFVKEPAFDYLRTKQQLGYIVMCLNDDHRGVLGLSVLVQSELKNTYQLQQYVDKFINQVLKEKLDSLDQATFQQYKTSLRSTKLQKDKNLSSETNRFWGEILKHSYEFKRKQAQAEAIPNISLETFKAFITKLFYDSPRIFEMHQMTPKSAQQVQVLRQARATNNPNFQVYPSVQDFRKRMQLYPDYYSHL